MSRVTRAISWRFLSMWFDVGFFWSFSDSEVSRCLEVLWLL